MSKSQNINSIFKAKKAVLEGGIGNDRRVLRTLTLPGQLFWF